MKTSARIRDEFLRFFAERGHQVVPSSPVVPQDDPTLLFTNAGMNQFKDVFLGTGKRAYTRAADTQKCIRVSGKHNDLEEVGVDTYHHTFFEMLGNWSFGDYFKEEAIAWAWELLTRVWKLPEDRLWVTVFGGDEKDGLPADDEASRIWTEKAGVPAARVLRFGRKDNFWEMGEAGPCGPCTEIHIDRGGPGSDPRDGADRARGVNAGNERFMEIWNLVFIQYNRLEDGSLRPLPAKHVDTGMGFERIVSVLQEKRSNYDTDIFGPIFRRIEALAGRTYGGGAGRSDIAFRVVADHVRALTSAIADGALPGNEGRGYVLRRLLRRAARFGRQDLAMTRPWIHDVVPAVAETLGPVFPEIASRTEHISHVIRSEEESFAATLDRGLALFEDVAAETARRGIGIIPGDRAWDLYATFGFPRDLIDLMARERSLAVDEGGWKAAEAAHRVASRGAGAFTAALNPADFEGLPPTRGCFYRDSGGDGLTATAHPLRLVGRDRLVLDSSPFYAESGGQVGDAGVIEGPGFRFVVRDTQKVGGLHVHLGALEAGDPARLPAEVTARVDAAHRGATMANHTATHLLHKALREVLGNDAVQQGSLVAPDRLRFDFTHRRAVTPAELEEIERRVNARIAENTPLRTTVEDLAAARSRGVTALFGEKYDDRVRVVDVGGWSTELCGGTHCAATGDIGSFAIVSEASVQAGVRRIEAVTRDAAVLRMQESRRQLRAASQALKAPPEEIPARIEALQAEIRELRKKSERGQQLDVAAAARRLVAEAPVRGGARTVVGSVPGLSADDLARVADAVRAAAGTATGVLFAPGEDRVDILAFATRDLVESGRVHAGDLVKEIAPVVGGKGGGRPDFAKAGGRDPSRVEEAAALARRLLDGRLGA